jgi:hypothetical protein
MYFPIKVKLHLRPDNRFFMLDEHHFINITLNFKISFHSTAVVIRVAVKLEKMK